MGPAVLMSNYPPNYATQIGPTAAIPLMNANAILIANADVMQSLTDASDYCSKRGIPTSNIRQFHFGTLDNFTVLAGLQNSASPAYVSGSQTIASAANYNGIGSGASLLTVLNNEIANYGASCVIFSTYTPTRFLTTDENANFCLPAVAAAAPITLTAAGLTSEGIPNTTTGLVVSTTLSALEGNFIPSNWMTVTSIRPSGRLGAADLTQAGMTFAELPLAAGGSSVYENAVTNALACEMRSNVAQAVHYSSATGSGDVYPTWSGAATAYAAYVAAQELPNATDIGSLDDSSSLASKLISSNPMSPQQTFWCALWLQSLNAPSFGPGYDDPSTWPFMNNYSLASGAFGGCWWSWSFNWGMNLLYNGASAVVMTQGEPYAGNISWGDEVFHFLLNQRVPLALAVFYSPTTSNSAVLGHTVFGDPLYAPYKSTFTPEWGEEKGLLGTRPPLQIGVS
jgi:hypothetical protein